MIVLVGNRGPAGIMDWDVPNPLHSDDQFLIGASFGNAAAMSNQLTGNVGLYLVCTELSRLGFNVMPTARNAKGVDIVGYDSEGRSFTVQVKALSKRNPVPLGTSIDHLPADYYVIVVHVQKDPVFHVLTRKDMKAATLSQYELKSGGTAYWLEPKNYYKKDEYVVDAWNKIRPA